MLFRDYPDTVFAVKRESPLIVGWGEGENFVASDIPALLKYTRKYSVLEEGDMAVCTAEGIRFYNEFGEPVEREVLTLHRETFGSLVLDEALPCGQWRELTEAEASALYRDAQMEEKHG